MSLFWISLFCFEYLCLVYYAVWKILKCCLYFLFDRMLLASEELRPYDRARVFLDEDFTAVEKFTVSFTIWHLTNFNLQNLISEFAQKVNFCGDWLAVTWPENVSSLRIRVPMGKNRGTLSLYLSCTVPQSLFLSYPLPLHSSLNMSQDNAWLAF